MTAADYTLNATATADGAGSASVTFQAPNVGARGLDVRSIALIVTGSTTIPVARVYRDVIAPGNVLASRTAGDRGSFTGEGDIIYMGQRLIVEWSNATPGAQCTAVLRGGPA